MSGTRELKYPEFEIEGDDGELLIRFRIPGSTLGPVEVVLELDRVDRLVVSLEQALAFAGATAGDSDG